MVGDNYDKIEQVAAVSANNDPTIGKLIADAMRKVSKDGVITIEEAKGTDTTIGVVEGMQFDRGYLSAYFVTDTEKMECVMEHPYILIYDKKISNFEGFLAYFGTGCTERTSFAGDCRRCRQRSFDYIGCKPSAFSVEDLCCESSGLRRPS